MMETPCSSSSEVIRVKTDPGHLQQQQLHRLHTFSSEMYEKLLSKREAIRSQLGGDSQVLFEDGRCSVLVLGASRSQVDLTSQIVCNAIHGEETSELKRSNSSELVAPVAPPRHPWEHKSLTHKSSLPPSLSHHLLQPPPPRRQLLAPQLQTTSCSPPPPSMYSQFGSGQASQHQMISRTMSDSFGAQNGGLGLGGLVASSAAVIRRPTAISKSSSLTASRRKLESEDSSYDSDQESHDMLMMGGGSNVLLPPGNGSHLTTSRSHDDVSRTPSETLAAEFSEHVTLRSFSREPSPSGGLLVGKSTNRKSASDLDQMINEPGYATKVEFALKLGYTEQLLQRALVKLGRNAADNQILEELIRLQKSKPGVVPSKDIRLTHSQSQPQILSPRPLPTEHALAAELMTSSEIIAADTSSSSSSSTAAAATSKPDLLPIVIDGSNVAMSHGNKDVFSCKGILICVNWFQQRGHKDITVFVPKWRKESPRPETPITEKHLLCELERDRILSFTPSRQVLGKRFVCHDDRYILNYAAETGALVVSNDNYRDLINEKPAYKDVIKERILMYSFVNDRFMPPDDPMGRNGPTLDQFLRRQPGSTNGSSSDLTSSLQAQQQQPCPYGKKCTYGNKCKYFHADRGAQPQKSVSDKLKESYSLRKIGDGRTRVGGGANGVGMVQNSRDASPGDPLTRTRSLQPSGNDGYMWDKQALCRTHSTVPRLTVSATKSGTGEAPSAAAPGSCYWQHVPPPMLPPTVSSRSFSVDNVAVAEKQQSVSPLPDTSMPPPPPRGPWHMPPTSEAGPSPPGTAVGNNNQHRKLARQLTINPSFDPRIHQIHHRLQPSSSSVVYPPRTDLPPPSMPPAAGSNHGNVTRNASAPEQGFSHLLQQQQQQQLQQQQQMQQQQQVSAVEAQLQKTLSDLSGSWNAAPAASTLSTSPLSAAISPLIGSSNGVWEASSEVPSSSSKPGPIGAPSNSTSGTEDTRSKFYYHLAAMFPEEQVLRAMRALPEETNPQKICSYILSLSSGGGGVEEKKKE